MAVLRVNSAQFAAYHVRLAARFMPTILRGVNAGAARAVSYLVDRTRTAIAANPAGIGTGGAVNTGAYLRQWKVIRTPNGAVIVNASSYAAIIEYGRRPGSKLPPKAAVIAWARRRLHLSAEDAARRWYPIARAIARRGLVGRKIMTADEAQKRIGEIVLEETIHELEREQGKP